MSSGRTMVSPRIQRMAKQQTNEAAKRLGATARQSRLKAYGYVLATTSAMLLIMFIARQIYPIGDKVLVYTDGTQYFSFLGYLRHTMYSNDNLLFSWGRILGGNMLGTLAYYCASPFNFLVAFFPDNLMAAYHFIFVVKFLAAALTFSVMLENMFLEADTKAVVLFSSSYPFIGYMTYYAWNQSWMDGIILMPIILLGIWRIVKYTDPLVYTVAVAVALFSNFYIGYMLCIASVMLFICLLALNYESLRGKKVLLKTIGIYVVSSLVAAALASVILIPAITSLPEARTKSAEELIDSAGILSRPEEIISMLYTAPLDNTEWKDNYPILFTGVVQLVLVVLFYLNKQIPARLKVVSGAVLVVLALSFSVSVINVAWHGFSKNIWFNYRYSFLLSFVLEILAYWSFENIQGAQSKLLLAGAIMAGLTIAALGTERGNVGPGTFMFDMLWICLALVLLHTYIQALSNKNGHSELLCYLLIAGLTFGNLSQNTYLTLNKLRDVQNYYDAAAKDRSIQEIIDDDGLYRIASTWRYASSDPMRVGFPGVENFASTENADVVSFGKRLGLRSKTSRTWYDGNTSFATDALLGLAYIIAADDSHKINYYSEIGDVQDSDLAVLTNPHALPFIFPGETRFNADGTEINRFEYINKYWNSISSVAGSIFQPTDYEITETETDEGTEAQISFTTRYDGPVYAYVPISDDLTAKVKMPADDQEILYIGDFHKGESGELNIEASGNGVELIDQIVLYTERLDVLDAKTSAVKSQDIEIEKVSSSHLRVQFTADRDVLMTSTIPYDEGWHVYIDGSEVEVYTNLDAMMAFDVSAGTHDIELIYWPPGLTQGIIISVIGGVVLTWYIIWRNRHATLAAQRSKDRNAVRKKRKNKKPVPA